MSEPLHKDTLCEIFKTAMNSTSGKLDSNQDHPIDNDELLIEWAEGELDDDRHRAVLDHLAGCSYCRGELADMIAAGALVLPETSGNEKTNSEPQHEEQTACAIVPQPRSHLKTPSKRSRLAVATAIAVSLLIAVIWGVSNRSGDSPLALARRDLDAGRPQAAMDRVEKYLGTNKSSTAEDRAEARRLLEASGYRIAHEQLFSGTAESRQQVLELEARVARHEAASGRMVNLRLQAERGVNTDSSLHVKSALTDYGYDETGNDYSKGGFSIPEINDTTKRLTREYAEAVSKHPESLELRLNFGHFLMEQSEFTKAALQFATAVTIDPKSSLAETGFGLALFQQDTDESIKKALIHFQKAVATAPDDPTANRNMAVCLMRLGRQEEAKPYFEKAADQSK